MKRPSASIDPFFGLSPISKTFDPTPPHAAAAGMFALSLVSGLLVATMFLPLIAVAAAASTNAIGVFDTLPSAATIGHQPERNTLWAVSNRAGSTNGYIPIATIYDQNREEVSYNEISRYALDATVAGEDRRFFNHGGVDISSVIRAGVSNAVSDQVESGASTLTMQLVKNMAVQQALNETTEQARADAYDAAMEQSLARKLAEMKMAIALEKQYTKKEILTAYLNIAFFGDNTYGIQAAAQRYFSTTAANLTLPQAASLIATVQYPNERGLFAEENYPANTARRDVILDAMFDEGNITADEHATAIATPVDATTVIPSTVGNGCSAANDYARWFCDYVVKNVTNFAFLGSDPQARAQAWATGGYDLYTTLDLDVQEQAQNATWQYAPNTETGFSLGSATSTVEAGTGRILVMTENKIFNDTLEGGGPTASAVNYNASVDYGGSTGFQSGSTYKLFTLLAWLQAGHTLTESVNASGRTVDQADFVDSCNGGWVGPYPFKNAGGEGGYYSVRNATTNSVNGAFISMALQLDLCNIQRDATALGVQRGDQEPLMTNPSSVLGTNEITPLSLASAYAAIGAGGLWCAPIMVDKATGPDGQELDGQAHDCKQVIDPTVAATALVALQSVITDGTGSASDPGDGIPLAGKTGTTDDGNQTWMASTTTRWGTAVWVGNSQGEFDIFDYGVGDVSGSGLRHAIARTTIANLNSKYPGGPFPAAPDQGWGSGYSTEETPAAPAPAAPAPAPEPTVEPTPEPTLAVP